MVLYTLSIFYADVAKLADALVLGTSANGVEVRVLSSAPMMYLFELIEQIDTNIILKRMVFFCCKKFFSWCQISKLVKSTNL